MPTVAQIGPYRFFFYSNEGDESPHVHAKREAKVARFWLDPVGLAAGGRISVARTARNRAAGNRTQDGMDRGVA